MEKPTAAVLLYPGLNWIKAHYSNKVIELLVIFAVQQCVYHDVFSHCSLTHEVNRLIFFFKKTQRHTSGIQVPMIGSGL